MTPKQKANELLTRYFTSGVGYGPIERDRAKRNAGLCVDELIRVTPWGGDAEVKEDDGSKEFYINVKNELDNL